MSPKHLRLRWVCHLGAVCVMWGFLRIRLSSSCNDQRHCYLPLQQPCCRRIGAAAASRCWTPSESGRQRRHRHRRRRSRQRLTRSAPRGPGCWLSPAGPAARRTTCPRTVHQPPCAPAAELSLIMVDHAPANIHSMLQWSASVCAEASLDREHAQDAHVGVRGACRIKRPATIDAELQRCCQGAVSVRFGISPKVLSVHLVGGVLPLDQSRGADFVVRRVQAVHHRRAPAAGRSRRGQPPRPRRSPRRRTTLRAPILRSRRRWNRPGNPRCCRTRGWPASCSSAGCARGWSPTRSRPAGEMHERCHG